MKTLRNNHIILWVGLILLSCKEDDKVEKIRVPINIYETIVPDSGIIDQDLQIQLKTVAGNGCHYDLKIEMVEINNNHFLFQASSLFTPGVACTENLVQKDTAITFTPTRTGKYYFQSNESDFEIRNDTLEVTE